MFSAASLPSALVTPNPVTTHPTMVRPAEGRNETMSPAIVVVSMLFIINCK